MLSSSAASSSLLSGSHAKESSSPGGDQDIQLLSFISAVWLHMLVMGAESWKKAQAPARWLWCLCVCALGLSEPVSTQQPWAMSETWLFSRCLGPALSVPVGHRQKGQQSCCSQGVCVVVEEGAWWTDTQESARKQCLLGVRYDCTEGVSTLLANWWSMSREFREDLSEEGNL